MIIIYDNCAVPAYTQLSRLFLKGILPRHGVGKRRILKAKMLFQVHEPRAGNLKVDPPLAGIGPSLGNGGIQKYQVWSIQVVFQPFGAHQWAIENDAI